MVRGTTRLASALCLLILISPLGTSVNEPTDDSPQIIIDQSQGLTVYSNINITGTYIDEQLPISITWEIYNGVERIDDGDLMDHLSESGDSHSSSRNSWQYFINLNFTSTPTCSCVLEIEATDTNGQKDMAQLILFTQDEDAESLTQLNPLIIFESPIGQLTGAVEIDTIAMDMAGSTSAQWAISNSSEIEISCIQSWIESPEQVQWHNMTAIIQDSSQSFTLDTMAYNDGEYSLMVRAVSDDLYSTCACKPIGIDNNAPTARIDGPSVMTEYSGSIQFDGTGSSDLFWGQDELVFLWVLEDELGEKTIRSGVDLRTFDVDASKSGNFTLTLTVVDNVGFSDTVSHEFNIINQVPVAALRIGGQALENGDQITLTDSTQWLVECSDSTDSDNDKSGLVCTWYVDDEPLMTGWSRQLVSPEDLSKPHTLMLEVTDDDGMSDTITVTFGVQDTASDPMYDEDGTDNGFWLMIAAQGAIFVTLILMMALLLRLTGKSTPIPKWKRE
tara:strand:+ start:4872 stop:6380 length:1509 start_codon:yes stop_codon:yes gene_type:complete